MDKEYHTSSAGWLFWTILSTVLGIAYCHTGVAGMIAGQLTRKLHTDNGTVVYDITFTGIAALVFCLANIGFGLSLMTLGFLLPRTDDPPNKKLSMQKLQPWERKLLVTSVVVFTVSLLWKAFGPFFWVL